MPAIRILGIDPGSRLTGFGVIAMESNHSAHIAGGCIRVGAGELTAKLEVIFHGVTQLIDQYQPDEMVVEKIFFHRNPASALKLGQARGAALMAGILKSIPIHEYTPAEIKQAVTGKGNASKEQVQYMIRLLLNLSEPPASDMADALAAALCHGHNRSSLLRKAGVRQVAPTFAYNSPN